MGVLVGIDVGDAEACILEAAHLGGGFGGDFCGVDAEGEEVADKVGEGGAQLAIATDQGGDLFRGQNGGSIDEEDVAANFESGVGFGGGYGVVKEGSGGHERGRGEGAGLVEFGDGAVDAGG
jgi:hypothetical protein